MTTNQQVLSDEQIAALKKGPAQAFLEFARAIESATLAALAQQAQEREPVAAVLGDIVALWDLYAPSQHMTAMHMHAKRALAGQQPVSPDMHRWCAYVGVMVAHWVMSEPNAHVRLGDDQFEAAIAGIIKRRLWAMPKRDTTPQPQPVPAPVDDRAEFEASMRKKHGWEDRDFKSDSFGYFDGHTATAWLAWQARAALTLPAPQQATPKPVVPEMSSIALRKLGGLQDRGWQVNGYAIRRGNERGFVDASGFVGWWRSEIAPVAPDDHPLMVFAKECELGAYMEREVPLAARKAIAASQQKGGQ